MEKHIAAIYNAAWRVRALARPHQKEERQQAAITLGRLARAAFNAATNEDFLRVLEAIRDAMQG